MISSEALELWERLAQECGDGPWDYDSHDRYYHVIDGKSWLVAQCEDRSEAAFIAEAREAVPALIARVRELEAARNRKTEKLNKLVAMVDWLVCQCETLSCYNPVLRQGMSKEQWRAAAKEGVQNDF